VLELNIFWTVIYTLASAIEWLIAKFIFNQSSILKNDKLKANLSFLIPIIITMFMSLNSYNTFVKFAINFALIILVYKYNYKESIIKSILVSLIFMMMLGISDSLSVNIIKKINSMLSDIDILRLNNLYRIELIVVSHLLLLLIIPLTSALKLTLKKIKTEYVYIVLPIIGNIFSFSVIIKLIYSQPDAKLTKEVIVLITLLVMLLSNTLLIYMIAKIIKIINMKNEINRVTEKMKMEYKHYLSLEKAKLGIETLFDTQNNFVDIILTEKKYECDDAGIELNVNIDFTECFFMQIMDTCNLFSNMLDNSIELCSEIKSNRKSIQLSGKVVNKFYVIKCTTSGEYLKIVADEEYIFKRSGQIVNLNVIKRSIERYKGVVEISDDNLVVTILIPLKQELFRKL